jgi:uncharacterized protein YjbI with pentapeptide repeats
LFTECGTKRSRKNERAENLAQKAQTDSDLSDTDLSDTDLSDTDLSDTDLSDTDLSDTDLDSQGRYFLFLVIFLGKFIKYKSVYQVYNF